MQVATPLKTSHFPGFALTVARQMADARRLLADRLVKEREAQSLSRDDLAYKSGVSAKTIKRIEKEQHDPRPSTIRHLAEGLKINVTDLRPPPEFEEQHLERLETKLDAIITHFEIPLPPLRDEDDDALTFEEADAVPDDAKREADSESGQ